MKTLKQGALEAFHALTLADSEDPMVIHAHDILSNALFPCESEIKTGETTWGVKFATAGPYRVLCFAEGGAEAFISTDGIGWVMDIHEEMPESVFNALLEAAKAS